MPAGKKSSNFFPVLFPEKQGFFHQKILDFDLHNKYYY